VAPLPNRESVAAAWLDVLQARNSDAPTSPASIDRAAFAADAEVGRRVLRANCKSGADAKCLFLNIASLSQAALAATPRGLASEMAFVLFSCFGTVLQDEPAPLHAALALLDYAQVCFGPSPYELVQFEGSQTRYCTLLCSAAALALAYDSGHGPPAVVFGQCWTAQSPSYIGSNAGW